MEELVLLFAICILIIAIFAGLIIWLMFKLAKWAEEAYRKNKKNKVISDFNWLLFGEEKEGK